MTEGRKKGQYRLSDAAGSQALSSAHSVMQAGCALPESNRQAFQHNMSPWQTANWRLVRLESVYPSISDMMLRRRKRRNGAKAEITASIAMFALP
jgi:hypothetical protein